MAVSIQVGNAEVIAIQDKFHPFDRYWHYPFVDPDAWDPYEDLLSGPGGFVMINFACFLIRADDRTILIDTGWGPTLGPPGAPRESGRLMDELAAMGVAVDDIDMVVLTHMHADHVGWMLDREGPEVKPMFGRARYLIPEGDWNHYTSTSEMHPNTRQSLDIGGFDVLDLIGDGHVVSPSIIAEATPGHSPGHTSYVIDSAGERLFILGDLVHHPVVAEETDWVHLFDADPVAAVEVRKRVLQRLEDDNTLVAAGHFQFPSLGRFVRVDGKRRWKPI